MAIDFPPNPAIDDTFTSGGLLWTWDGVKWVATETQTYLPLSGGQLSGDLVLAADPTTAMEATTKEYVDNEITSEVAAAIGGVIGVPIGGIIVWAGDLTFGAGGGVPADFLLCNGAYYNPVDAPVLFNVIGGGYGWDGTNFAVPNLLDRVPVGAGGSWGISAAGGEISHVLDGNELTYHDHGIYDIGHAHSLSDPGHNHYLNDPTHAHGIGDPGHAHTYQQWYSPAVNIAPGSGGSQQTNWTGASGTGVYTGGAYTGTFNSAAGTGQGVYAALTGVLTYANGASWAHNNMQPFIALYYIIRYQ
jgi:microcystin-dependent protein